MKKENFSRYSCGLLICFLVVSLTGFAIAVACLTWHNNYKDTILSIIGFLFGLTFAFILIFGRKITINHNKKHIVFWSMINLEFIVLPMRRKIHFDEINTISSCNNQIIFTLLSDNPIHCIASQSITFSKGGSHRDKAAAAYLVKKIAASF